MAMIEKSLMVIIFMYAASFSMLGIQYTLDSVGFDIIGANGEAMESQVIGFINTGELNERTEAFTNPVNGTEANPLDNLIGQPITAAAAMVVEIFTLMTGTYIFNILFFVVGIPTIWISGFVVLYFFMLMRTIVAYLRGI